MVKPVAPAAAAVGVNAARWRCEEDPPVCGDNRDCPNGFTVIDPTDNAPNKDNADGRSAALPLCAGFVVVTVNLSECLSCSVRWILDCSGGSLR